MMKVKIEVNADMSPSAMHQLMRDARESDREPAAFLRDLLTDNLESFDDFDNLTVEVELG